MSCSSVRTYKDEFPEAFDIILHHLYVDDCIAGAATEEDAIRIRRQLNDLLQHPCMTLRKWRTNSPALLHTIPEDIRETECPGKKHLHLNNASTAVQPDSLQWFQTPWSQTTYKRLLTQAHQKIWGLQLPLQNHHQDGRSHHRSDDRSLQEPATPKQATNSNDIHVTDHCISQAVAPIHIPFSALPHSYVCTLFAHCHLHSSLSAHCHHSLYKHPFHEAIFLVYSALKSVDSSNRLVVELHYLPTNSIQHAVFERAHHFALDIVG